jgi:acetyltransferase-like isoleucine patch superfamily enzyme
MPERYSLDAYASGYIRALEEDIMETVGLGDSGRWIPVTMAPSLRERVLLYHFQSKIVFNNGYIVELGRGSHSLIQRVMSLPERASVRRILKVGDFCESANAKIVLGGEHIVGDEIIITYNGLPVFQRLISKNNKEIITNDETVIGNGCILSQGAIILSGAKIGDNCVVGAHSVVARQHKSNSVIAGIPGVEVRTLNEKSIAIDGVPASIFDLKLSAKVEYFNNGKREFKKSDLTDRTKFVIYSAKMKNGLADDVKFYGIESGGEKIEYNRASKMAKEYFSQLFSERESCSVCLDLEDIL